MKETIYILLVDDKQNNLTALAAVLEDENYELIQARSAEEALRFLMRNHEHVALIILDIQMPGVDGFEAAKLIKGRNQTKHIPIIFLSAHHIEEQDIFRGYELGAFDYMTKPFHPELLKSKVRVFVDFYKMTLEKLQWEEERLFLQWEEERLLLEELKHAESAHQTLTGWQTGSITAKMVGIGPLRERKPELFSTLQADYEALIDLYLTSLIRGVQTPGKEISRLAKNIGDQSGSPRDVVDLHRYAIARKSEEANPKRIKAYTIEGRLLALELMGYLVDYYRLAKHLPDQKRIKRA